MTKTTRHLVVGLMMTGLVGVGRLAAADEGGPATRRVRSSNPAIVALIQRASDESATFRRLVDAIDASDGIVYVEEGACGHGVRACLAGVMTAGPTRFLRVKVDTRKADWDLMGSIGHELRHTIEVLGQPSVRSSVDMYFFYERQGRHGTGGTFETQAATDAGAAVRDEVRHALKRDAANRH